MPVFGPEIFSKLICGYLCVSVLNFAFLCLVAMGIAGWERNLNTDTHRYPQISTDAAKRSQTEHVGQVSRTRMVTIRLRRKHHRSQLHHRQSAGH